MAYRGKYPNRVNSVGSTTTKGVYALTTNQGARFYFAVRDCIASGIKNDTAQLMGRDVSEFPWLKTTIADASTAA